MSKWGGRVTLGFIALFVVLLYTFLHEASHALVGLAVGGEITSFSISFWALSAHVSLIGVPLENQRIAVSVAGVILPIAVWAVFISCVPKRANLVLEGLKLTSSLWVINTLLPWILLPLLYLIGAPPGDDVTVFLDTSQFSPISVAGASLALYMVCWWLFTSRIGRIQSLKSGWLGQLDQPLARDSARTLITMAVIASGVILIAGGASIYLAHRL